MNDAANSWTVLGVSADHDCVELWSEQRLPFQPKDWLVDMRSDLRAALAGLRCGRDQVLHATFTSAITGAFDIENVLFYNVGASYFQGNATRGIRFERSFTPPPASPGNDRWPRRYAGSPFDGPFAHWERGRRLASWVAARFGCCCCGCHHGGPATGARTVAAYRSHDAQERLQSLKGAGRTHKTRPDGAPVHNLPPRPACGRVVER
jgi:hypothetical protein